MYFILQVVLNQDSYYFPSSHLRHTIWLDRKNQDRIENWLTEQHEYTGYPPPETESVISLRSSSAVDLLTGERSLIDEVKYKSEERIQQTHFLEVDDPKQNGLFKRYNSPDCIRRRYFSPRSDPALNTVGKQSSLLPTRSASYKQLWHSNGEYSSTDHRLNPTFYQAGKGNTFPRRGGKFAGQREFLQTQSTENMGQQMDKYQQKVLLNPYASVTSTQHDSDKENRILNRQVNKQVEESFLVGRTFVLNGISLHNKPDVSDHTSTPGRNSSVAATQNTLYNSTEIIDTSTSNKTDNEKVSMNNSLIKEVEERVPSPISHTEPRSTSTYHQRVVSAPATTDSTHLQRDPYWRGETAQRKISHEVRKVKAFSWPKRAVLPQQTDKDFMERVTRKQTFNSDQNKTNETNSIPDDASDQSDVPPARPPLPAEHMYPKRDSSSAHRTSSLRSTSQLSQACSQISEEEIIPQEIKHDEHQALSESSYASSSAPSQNFQHSSTCELSKRVSMSLKDLIRIHEKEIARVSGAFSTRTLDKIDEKASSVKSRDEAHVDHSKWKRHTTIGLLGDFTSYPSERSASGPLSPRSDGSLLSPDARSSSRHSARKFNITISSRAASSDASELVTSPLSPKDNSAFKSPPPNILPKPKKVTTSSMVTSPLQTVVAPLKAQTHEEYNVPFETSYIAHTSDTSVQTEGNFSRTASFRKNEKRVRELTEEKELMKISFEEERKELNRKLQEQKKVANAYQKLEDRYRKKVYELQKAMKMCSCSGSRYFANGIDNFRQDHSSPVNDHPNDISVQKVDGILHQLEAWLNHHTNGITYPDSDISSLFGSNAADEVYVRNSKRASDHYNGNGSIPLDRIIDRIDATSV
ncbi:uncharacterized protein [Clytia hemisphaerica]|uniref:uncharacterized protein isoform X2 n=1 Tax=Clytia hemisphaerica TaxID=252671 RepID=UPI0034D47D4E